MCHEMGHTLNLRHSENPNDIMYHSGVGQDEDRLSSNDYRAITSVYGGPNGKVRNHFVIFDMDLLFLFV